MGFRLTLPRRLDYPSAAHEDLVVTHQRDNFYFCMAWALAIAVFVGFAPTFYLGALFDLPRLHLEGMEQRPSRPLEHMHGFIATLWIALFIAQTGFVRSTKISRHRKLGIAGMVLGVILVVQIIVLMFQTASARNAAGILDEPFVTLTNRIFWGNVVMVVPMAVLMTFGYLNRRNRQFHRRLMLLLMLCLLPATVGRIARFELPGLPMAAVSLLILLGFLSAPVIHDYITRQRVHPLYLIGCPAILLLTLLAAFLLPQLNFVRGVVALL